jgi:hypothetical protein
MYELNMPLNVENAEKAVVNQACLKECASDIRSIPEHYACEVFACNNCVIWSARESCACSVTSRQAISLVKVRLNSSQTNQAELPCIALKEENR